MVSLALVLPVVCLALVLPGGLPGPPQHLAQGKPQSTFAGKETISVQATRGRQGAPHGPGLQVEVGKNGFNNEMKQRWGHGHRPHLQWGMMGGGGRARGWRAPTCCCCSRLGPSGPGVVLQLTAAPDLDFLYFFRISYLEGRVRER